MILNIFLFGGCQKEDKKVRSKSGYFMLAELRKAAMAHFIKSIVTHHRCTSAHANAHTRECYAHL